jgi:hypothetical protein
VHHPQQFSPVIQKPSSHDRLNSLRIAFTSSATTMTESKRLAPQFHPQNICHVSMGAACDFGTSCWPRKTSRLAATSVQQDR